MWIGVGVVGPIVRGDRGPAVQDIQQRLLALGFDLGPTGVDGVFLGETLAAVRSFQRGRGLEPDGIVGDETWAALVDATFRLGDRLLYLRLPYLHGVDVRTLQGALNVLGFACGTPDGIFGAFTERAVREFQANVSLPADGIAGTDTVGALERLRHVWQGKDPSSPAALSAVPARAAEALRRVPVTIVCADACAREVAGRVANLAVAVEPAANVTVADTVGGDVPGLILRVGCTPSPPSTAGLPLIVLPADAPAEGRFIAAFQASPGCCDAVVHLPAEVCKDEHGAQASAVRILDGVCAVLS